MYEQPIHVGFSGNQGGSRINFAVMTTADLPNVSIDQTGKGKGKKKPIRRPKRKK